MSEPVAIAAATLVVMREAAGPPELLIIERAKALSFAGGALVFPGGRVDPGDRELAATIGLPDNDDAAARVAAIRETIEEAGLAIGLNPAPWEEQARATMRQALHAGVPFGDVLRDAEVHLDLTALTPFARWRPMHRIDRVFDTRFYLSALPAGSPEASVDATETVGLRWSSAVAVLAAADAGRATLIFPTRRNLERLARFGSHAQAAADAAAHPVETISPWVEERDGARHLCIPEGLGYPITSEPLERATRG